MGQVCSSEEEIAMQVPLVKDANDQEIDNELEMEFTNLSEFDSFFEKAFVPVLEVKEMHDSILRSQEKVKEAAAVVEHLPQVMLTSNSVEFDNDIMEMALYMLNEKGEPNEMKEEQVANLMKKHQELHQVYAKTQMVLSRLNDDIINTSAEELTRWIFFDGRVKITETGKNDTGINELNMMLFKLKKELAQAANISRLSQAIQVFTRESKVALGVKVQESGSIQFVKDGQEMQLNKMEMPQLSAPALLLRDAIVELQERMEKVASDLPQLSTQISKFVGESKELPKKVTEAGSAMGFSAQDIRKSESAAHENVKKLSRGTSISKSTMSMMRQVAREVSQAFIVPIGA